MSCQAGECRRSSSSCSGALCTAQWLRGGLHLNSEGVCLYLHQPVVDAHPACTMAQILSDVGQLLEKEQVAASGPVGCGQSHRMASARAHRRPSTC